MNIDYIEKTGRFVISCPPWDVAKVRAIPNRRWDPRTKLWTAPAIRVNADYIKNNIKAAMTAKAVEAMERALAGRKPVAGRFPAWYGFKTKPFKHQITALNRMYDNHAFALFMDMRTGKSKTLIDCASAYHIEGKVDTVVITCPYSIRHGWVEQWGEHSPVEHSIHVLDANKKKQFDSWVVGGSPMRVLIVGLESLQAGGAATMVERLLLTSTRVMFCIDESHGIKTPSATRSKVCQKLGLMANYRVIMTGTSTAHGPMDLFMQFEFLDPAIIGVGDYYSFRNRYAVMGGYEDRQIIGYQNMDELMELISPFVYEVSRDDVFDIPPKQYTKRFVRMDTKQKELYTSMSKNKFIDTDDGVLVANTVLEKMLRLHEIAGGSYAVENLNGKPKYLHYRVEGENAKVKEVLNVAEECDCSIIIWANRRLEIEMIVEALAAKYGRDQVVEVHGGIEGEDRHSNVYDKFQTGKARFLVGTPAAGGMSYKMSAAGVVIYYSNSFNYVDRKQSEDRTQSSDQINSVMYIDLVAEGTVDEIALEAIAAKQDVSDYVKSRINEITKRISIA